MKLKEFKLKIRYFLDNQFGRFYRYNLLNWIPDNIYLNIIFYLKMGKKLNLKKPKTFNEKLQWLKLYDRKKIYTQLVDKYEVRSYIEKKLGKKYLIPLLGKYEKFDDIDFNNLPNQFVLKCTHDSGGLVICKDKKTFNKELAREKINRCLQNNYFYWGREWPYKNVKPQIICEKYMVDESNTELKDYKIMCFNGQAKCAFVCLNRDKPTGLNVDFYDLNWKPMPFERHYPRSNSIIPKPKKFEEMIQLAEILAQNNKFLRVDFYEINGEIYFGELTFYPGSGLEEFTPEIYDELLGSWINIC